MGPDLRKLCGSASLSDDNVDALARFMASSDHLESRSQAVELLCILQALVAHSEVTAFPTAPADCFCGAWPFTNDFQNAGDELRFIINCTTHVLARKEGATI